MLGAIAGDALARSMSTVLTVAVAECLLTGSSYVDAFHEYFLAYPLAGYRFNFFQWASSGDRMPYNSWAMAPRCVSAVGSGAGKRRGPGRIYVAEPTGAFMDDPNLTDRKFPGNPTKSYRSREPLRVVGEYLDWQGHSEEIQAIKDAMRVWSPSTTDQGFSLAHEFHDVPVTDRGAPDHPVLADGDPFGKTGVALRRGIGNERGDLAVFDATNVDAPMKAGVVAVLPRRIPRLGIGDIQHIVVNAHAARTAELPPLGDELPAR